MRESKRGSWSLGLLGALLLAVACGGPDETCTEDGVCVPDPSDGERGRDGGTDGGDDDRDGGRDGGDDDDCDGGDDDDCDDDDDDDGRNRGPG